MNVMVNKIDYFEGIEIETGNMKEPLN